MSEKRLSEYDVQIVNRDEVERQLIESNIEPLAEGNRIEYALYRPFNKTY